MDRNRIGHICRRLREVGPAELAYRLRQRGYGLCRRAISSVRPLALSDDQLRSSLVTECGTPERALAHFRSRDLPLLPRTSVGEAWLASLGRFDGGRRTIEHAERFSANCLVLLNREWYQAGETIDWHRRFGAAGSWPRDRHWSAIDPRRPGSGDIKLTWELNRLQHFITLGRAFRYTSRKEFAEAFRHQFRSWREQNPFELGVNWADCLEVAVRMLSLARAHALFRPTMDPNTHWEILKSIIEHADYVLRFNTDYANANNHLIGEAVGLFVAGVSYAEFRAAGEWESWGRKRLEREIQRQVHPDGGSKEASTDYHCFVTELFLQAHLLAERSGRPMSPAYGDRLTTMIKFVGRICRPDGTIPQIADGDDAVVFATDLERRPQTLLAVGAAVFDRPDLAPGGQPSEDAVWCLSEEKAAASAMTERGKGSRAVAFPNTGWVVWRSEWSQDSDFLLFDAGPFSLPWTRVHGHASRLNLDLFAAGHRVLTDPGTFTYYGDPGLRDYFRKTSSHSCLVLNGDDQATMTGTFAWKTVANGRLVAWGIDPRICYALGAHDGYLAQFGASVSRFLVYLPGDYLLVVDAVEGGSDLEAEVYWHFDAGELEITDSGFRFRPRDANRYLRIVDLGLEDRSLEKGWLSEGYGRKYETPVGRSRLRGRWAATVFQLSEGDPLELISAGEEEAFVARVRVERPSGNDLLVFATRPVPQEVGGTDLVGTFAFRRVDSSGTARLEAGHGARRGRDRPETAEPDFIVVER